MYDEMMKNILSTKEVPEHWKHLTLYEWRALRYAEYIGIVSEYKVRGYRMNIYWNFYDNGKRYTQKEVINLKNMEIESCETLKRGFNTGWIR